MIFETWDEAKAYLSKIPNKKGLSLRAIEVGGRAEIIGLEEQDLINKDPSPETNKTAQVREEFKKISIEDARKSLVKVFGFNDFRNGQEEIVSSILAGDDVLAVMPTGAGKSLCYQLPAVISPFLTVVISPLVALIDDQVSSLNQMKIGVSKLHSGLSQSQNNDAITNFSMEKNKILYLSPERLMQSSTVALLKHKKIGMFVVDEAHCISKWGPDFRPEYAQLSQLKVLFSGVQIVSFTATADKETRADISNQLSNGNGKIFVKGFDRPNLSLKVLSKSNIKNRLIRYLEERKGMSGIIYCLSRREVDDISSVLNDNGFNTIPFHAGKDPDYKREAQNRFMTEDGSVMVATIAFGMGIDKPDIRFVVHANLPSSVEAFYQEIGRAGRDGLDAETVLYYGYSDWVQRRKMILDKDSNEKHKLLELKRLDALVGYCETASCRKQALLSYFDESIDKCGNCDNCLNPPRVKDFTEIAKKILLTILAIKESFGITHVIQVLRGVANQKIQKFSHEKLSVFGSAEEYSEIQLSSLIRQLVVTNKINVNLFKYTVLEVTKEGKQFLENNEKFMAKEEIANIKGTPIKSKKTVSNLNTDDKDLLYRLKSIRLKLANERKVPAFVIFSDRTLMEIAEKKPMNIDEFLKINGVGEQKATEFFRSFSRAYIKK